MYDKAIADYTEAIRLDPNNAHIYSRRADAHLQKGKLDKAITDYTEAIRLNPRLADVYCNRAAPMATRASATRPLPTTRRRSDSTPSTPGRIMTEAMLSIRKATYDKAIADYTDAIRLKPKWAEAYYNRGAAHADKDEPDKAIADYAESIRLDPQHAATYYGRGVAYGMKCDYDKAIADFTEAIRLNPKLAQAYYSRGWAYSAQRRPRQSHRRLLRGD